MHKPSARSSASLAGLSISVVLVLLNPSLLSHVRGQQAWDFSVSSQSIGWPQDYPSCQSTTNSAQSPIDFAQVPVDFSLKPLLSGEWGETSQFKVSSVDKVSLTIFPLVGIPSISHPTTRRFYRLVSAKVYSPSMHTFGGAPRDLEIALLHELSDPDQETTNEVAKTPVKYISVSLTFTGGSLKVDNTFLESILGVEGSIPSGGSFEEALNTTLNRTVDWASAVPLSRDYFFYEGSLPTPPCTANVEHYIHTSASRMSYSQLADIRRILGFTSGLSGTVSGFEDLDAPATTAAAFEIEGNVRTIPTPIELRKQILTLTTAAGGQGIKKFMDFVGDTILLKEPQHSSFMDNLKITYGAVYGLGVIAFVFSLLALRIGIS